MALIIPGSDMTLAVTVDPLWRHDRQDLVKCLDALRALGYASVQFDATRPGLRARELSARARKDLLATLARQSVQLCGLDLFIPRKHWLDDGKVDRALAVTQQTLELAADLGRIPVSIALPAGQLPTDVADAVISAVDAHSVPLAVHGEDHHADLHTWLKSMDMKLIRAAVDPAAVLASGRDPAQVISELGDQCGLARLSDYEPAAAARCALGQGELDVLAYRVAVSLASHRFGPVVVDLRHLEHPLRAAELAKAQWDQADVL